MSIISIILLSFTVFGLSSANLKSKATKLYIGTALNPDRLTEPQYASTAAQQFNCMTPEYGMKWGDIEATRGKPDYSKADQLVAFAQKNGMKVRGHALIWHQMIPDWIYGITDKTELQSVMRKHITDVMNHFKGKLYVWDVLNEIFEDDGTFRNSYWYQKFGEDYIADALRTAHSVEPNIKLYINDYTIETINKKSDALFNLVKKLKSQGVPIHGVGLQSHFFAGEDHSQFYNNIKRFSDIGIDVAVTELDIRIQLPSSAEKLKLQAQDYALIVKTCQDVERCVGVTVWGFTDKYSWIPDFYKGYGDACVFDTNYNPKPAVNAIENVLK